MVVDAVAKCAGSGYDSSPLRLWKFVRMPSRSSRSLACGAVVGNRWLRARSSEAIFSMPRFARSVGSASTHGASRKRGRAVTSRAVGRAWNGLASNDQNGASRANGRSGIVAVLCEVGCMFRRNLSMARQIFEIVNNPDCPPWINTHSSVRENVLANPRNYPD